MRVNYTAEAVNEVLLIFRYYEEKQLGLGRNFSENLDSVIASCRENPKIGKVLGGQFRRLVMPKFPYNIIYKLDPDEIKIISVAHQQRLPGYWRDRKG